MIIHGLQKLTLVDYPGRMAAILFTGACNFRCPFCHNGSLVLNPNKEPVIPEEEVFEFLKKRQKMLDCVVVSGGEPTINKDLLSFLGRIKELGYSVKLDTNGYRPEVLEEAIKQGLVDYVAMDIKNSLDAYPKTTGLSFFSEENIKRSTALLLSGEVDYEFRTTVVKEYHYRENFEKIGAWLKGARRYYLQSFADSEDTIEKGLNPPTLEDLKNYQDILKSYIDNVQIRDM